MIIKPIQWRDLEISAMELWKLAEEAEEAESMSMIAGIGVNKNPKSTKFRYFVVISTAPTLSP